MAHDVFISYSSADKPIADAVCAGLERRGLRCWIAPRDILPGLDWGAAIIDAINDARAMVLVFSSSANSSKQIKREVERAVAKGVPLIPLRVEDVPLGKTLEYFISSEHWMDALSRPVEPHVERLAEAIRALLARPSRAPDSGITAERRIFSAGSSAAAAAHRPLPEAATPAPRPAFRPDAPLVPLAPPPPRSRAPWIVAGAAAFLLAIVFVSLASRAPAPQILSVQFPNRIYANNTPAHGAVFFKSRKGDIATARFDVVSASSFPSFSFPVQGVAGLKEGSIGFFLHTPLPQRITLKATLIDASGRESNPVPFAFDAVAAPVAAPVAPPQPLPRRRTNSRGFEIQAPNGFRFKVK